MGAVRSSSPIWSCSAWGLPCRANYSARGALLPHLFTLTGPLWGEPAVYSLWHFPLKPLERFPPAVSRHAALRRPDFPPVPLRNERLSARQHQTYLLMRGG